MALVIKKSYPYYSELVNMQINCIDKSEIAKNLHLKIGIYNIMPEAEKYELSILKLLGNSLLQIEPIFIKAENHSYRSSNKEHIDTYYTTFEQYIEHNTIDGLIITGAPVEKINFNEVTYADELIKIFDFAQQNIVSTIGICWGGIAIAEYLGLKKEIYQQKLCGLFETQTLIKNHFLTKNFNDVFYCPQSRYAGISADSLTLASQNNKVNLLVNSDDAESYIFETPNHKLIAHLGHPEYDVERILFEYHRDISKGLSNIPKNINLEKPINNWRENANLFFSNWLQYIFECK